MFNTLIILMLCFFSVSCASFGNIFKKNDLHPYITKIRKQINKRLVLPDEVEGKITLKSEVTVQFIIMPEGYIEDLEVIDAKGEEGIIKELMKASLQAVVKAGPFSPIPPEILDSGKDQCMQVSYTFYFEKEKENKKLQWTDIMPAYSGAVYPHFNK